MRLFHHHPDFAFHLEYWTELAVHGEGERGGHGLSNSLKVTSVE